jgi:pimeloyl-ACP methyl ester carboxylesterase
MDSICDRCVAGAIGRNGGAVVAGETSRPSADAAAYTAEAAASRAEEEKEFAEMNLTDHAGVRLTHGKPKVNGVEIHYAIGGAGEPVFLLHGVPKTMLYWRHVVPLLTPYYTVIAVDNRGAGGSQRPLAGYDTATMAGDVAELATHLGFDQFRVAGEDWGAASEMYRARQTDAEQNRPHYADPISCPVLAVGAQAYLGDEVSKQLTQVARDVRGAVIPAAGHNIALENPAALAQAYLDFFAGG